MCSCVFVHRHEIQEFFPVQRLRDSFISAPSTQTANKLLLRYRELFLRQCYYLERTVWFIIVFMRGETLLFILAHFEVSKV